jgi:hypothetical protein
MSKPIDYYMNLVTSQYRNSPNFLNWLQSTLQKVNDETEIVDQLTVFFDIDTAIGKQLDILGQVIGQVRQVNFQPTDGSSSILSDTEYRVLLKAKIIKNQWKGQIEGLSETWKALFPNGDIIITDNQDMTMNVIIAGNTSLLTRDLVRNGYIVPKPEGVRVNYFFSEVPIFAYDIEDNGFFAGYDKGNWARTIQEVPMFSYDKDEPLFKGFDNGWWSN